MIEEVARRFWRFATPHIFRTGHKLMPVGQNPSRHQRGVLKSAKPKRNIDAVRDVIDEAFGNQNLYADVGVAGLERGDERGQ